MMHTIKTKRKIERYFKRKGLNPKDKKTEKKLLIEGIMLASASAGAYAASGTHLAKMIGVNIALPAISIILLLAVADDMVGIIKLKKYNKICKQETEKNE